MPKITKRLIDTLRPDPNGAEVFRWDSELRGFGVRIMPSGVASYHIQYRTPEVRLGAVMREAETMGEHDIGFAVIRFLLMTGLRRAWRR
jgi:hypothetical protein